MFKWMMMSRPARKKGSPPARRLGSVKKGHGEVKGVPPLLTTDLAATISPAEGMKVLCIRNHSPG
jgi:hypothetical protein